MMDEEIKERARNAIRLIFEAAAYEVEEVDAPLDLSATKEGICTVILVDDGIQDGRDDRDHEGAPEGSAEARAIDAKAEDRD